MSNPTELPDLDLNRIEKIAREAKESIAISIMPETLLELVRLARRAQPEGEATPSAAVSKAWDRFERAVGKPEGEAPQAEPVAYLRQSTIDRLAKNETTGTAWALKMADDYVPVYLAACRAQPEGEAPQAVAPHLEPVGRVKDHFAGTDKAYRTVEWADRTFAMDVPDGASLYAAPITAPAAQHAESGANE